MFEAVLEDARTLEPAVEVITQHSGLRTLDFDCLGTQDFALLIAPEFDGILERIVREVAPTGCRLLGPMPGAIAMTADKWALFQHWKRLKVPTPATWLQGDLPLVEGLYLKKHRYGAGSLGVSWWKRGEEVTEHDLVQAYAPGRPVSVALLIAPNGRATPLLPAWQQMDEGFGYLGGSFIDDNALAKRVTQLALQSVQQITGLHGYVGVDAILGQADDGSQDVVLEINPRLTTSYLGLRKASSVNLVQCMLDIAAGRDVSIQWNPGGVRWTAESCMK